MCLSRNPSANIKFSSHRMILDKRQDCLQVPPDVARIKQAVFYTWMPKAYDDASNLVNR